MQQKKHWVFDLDGTLVDSFSHFFASVQEIFNDHQATFTSELHYQALTQPLTSFFQTHLGANAVSPAMIKLQERSNEHAVQISPFTGAMELIHSIRQEGGRIAIWTNRDPTSANLILESTGIKKHIEICVSGTCTVQRKPHPEGLLKIINQFGCTLDQVVMIGDHEHDVTAAKTAGVQAVRASWHSYWPVETCTLSDKQFHCFDEFSSWVKSTLKPSR